MSYQDYRRIKAWRQKQKQAQKAREALRPLADAFAALPDLGLDSLPVLDLTSVPDPWECDTTPTQSQTAGETAERNGEHEQV